jgi:MoaA/NifB/PqqE/SkfB family radical SAM enzyme
MKKKILSAYNFDYLTKVYSILKLFPSLHIGSKGYHYFFRRKVNISMYITNRCNSRCVICNHWEQPVKYDLSLNAIKNLVNSKVLNKNGILIQGGEPLLHPNVEEILELFRAKKFNNIVLLTNGILTDRLVKLVEKFKIANVTISLDGPMHNYGYLRGVDNYENVISSIDLLKSKTNLAVCFTASRWNTYEDYLQVQEICQKRNIRFMVNIYSRMEYIDRPNEELPIHERYEKGSANPYVTFYNDWVKGKVIIPCLAMRFLAVIRPNGNVSLCQCKNNIVLGNLYENTLDEIWNNENTKSIQKAHRFCNDCWVASHRPFDIKFAMLMKRLFPLGLSTKIFKSL